MTLEQYLLMKLAEECAEVAQRCSKQMQFGRSEVQPKQDLTNAERLQMEIIDLKAVVLLLEEYGQIEVVAPAIFQTLIDLKRKKIEKYYAISRELGTVE